MLPTTIKPSVLTYIPSLHYIQIFLLLSPVILGLYLKVSTAML